MTHHHSNMTKILVSCMPHNEAFQYGKGPGASQLSVQNIPCSDFCRVPHTYYLLFWESFLFLLLMTVKVKASFTSSTDFPSVCGAATWSGVCCCPWPTQCWVCRIASLHHCLPSATSCWNASTVVSPMHLATDPTLDLWKVACGLQWWSLCSIACLNCCIPMPPTTDLTQIYGSGLWAAMVEPL